MTIISAKPAKNHVYELVFDDGQNGSVDKTVWEHSGYAVSSVLTPEEWETLCCRSQTHRAREKALYYLSHRDYGSGELIRKLCQSGIERTLATETVQRLAESGLIDDNRYAKLLARDLQSRKLYPKRRIALALKEKGFSSDVIQSAVESLADEEEQQALELLRKKRYNIGGDPSARNKALAMLSRYGYSYSVSRRAIERLEQEDDE